MTTTPTYTPLAQLTPADIPQLSGIALRVAVAEAMGLKLMHPRHTRGEWTWTYNDKVPNQLRTNGPYPEIPAYESDPAAAYAVREWMRKKLSSIGMEVCICGDSGNVSVYTEIIAPEMMSDEDFRFASPLHVDETGKDEHIATCRAAVALAIALREESKL